MPHNDAIIHAYSIEFKRNTACRPNIFLDDAPELLQMHMAGNDINIGVRHTDEGLIHVTVRDPASLQEGTMRGPFKTFFDHI